MKPHELELDDRWLTSILGTTGRASKRTLSDKDSVTSGRQKRQRKEKRIFDPSVAEEDLKTKLKAKQKEKDALLLHQSPFEIRNCFVKLDIIILPTSIKDEVEEECVTREPPQLTEEEEEEFIEEMREEADMKQTQSEILTRKAEMFSLSKEQKDLLKVVISIKPEKDASANRESVIYPCPKCSKEFSSLNRIKLHVDSGHEKFTVKVSS
jgi:hypothetical protein